VRSLKKKTHTHIHNNKNTKRIHHTKRPTNAVVEKKKRTHTHIHQQQQRNAYTISNDIWVRSLGDGTHTHTFTKITTHKRIHHINRPPDAVVEKKTHAHTYTTTTTHKRIHHIKRPLDDAVENKSNHTNTRIHNNNNAETYTTCQTNTSGGRWDKKNTHKHIHTHIYMYIQQKNNKRIHYIK